MLFKCHLYCLNDRTGNHYNNFNSIMQAETHDELKEKLHERGYMDLEKDGDKYVMVRPVGCRDTEFIVIKEMTEDDLDL